MTRLALAVAVTLVPGLAAAQDFSGTYQLGGCGAPTDGRIQISGSRIVFWESTCQLTNPVAVRDMGDATLFDVSCTGEGESWSFRAFLQSGGEGMIMVRDGFAYTYPRCN